MCSDDGPRQRRACVVTLCVMMICAAPWSLGAQVSATSVDLALRTGYHAAWRRTRDGARSDVHELRARIQAGVRWGVHPAAELRVRTSARVSTKQSGLRFVLSDHVSTTDGLALGEATLDELHVHWRPHDRWAIRAGRMQTTFELAGVPRKSLDRNDSPNTDISWTDGVHATFVTDRLRYHAIVQHQSRRGATNLLRPPLDVSGHGSRASFFGAIQATNPLGVFTQRELSVTFLPNVLPVINNEGEGTSGGMRDYVALSARTAAELPLQVLGGRVVLASEIGYAPLTPHRLLIGTGTTGTGNGLAMQASANVLGAVNGRHSLGIVYALAGDGWLISPDVRENNAEWEMRHYWQYASWGRLDTRLRLREDVRKSPGAQRSRHEMDLYLRTTIRFATRVS